ncbi:MULTISPECIES: fimbrial protein [unclassified Serratia (in: enterobacteria)]|uniref:fimbrial protein n=1 Tax=unclassified Serratia (in: enterobacteria) TaxID=2647522 RepID=UPI0030766830
MRLLNPCRNTVLLLGALVLGCSVTLPVWAVTLNFSALLMPGTCTFSLDRSTLVLGAIIQQQLKPATLVAAQPFTLRVQDCSGTNAALTPVVSITGDGVTQDGRWLFRTADSEATGVGVMLVKTDTQPSYSATEIKNNDYITLAAQGVNPVDQSLAFYAGMTCGSTGCGSVQVGGVTARVTFSLAYR